MDAKLKWSMSKNASNIVGTSNTATPSFLVALHIPASVRNASVLADDSMLSSTGKERPHPQAMILHRYITIEGRNHTQNMIIWEEI